jgi:hypothetical protein
MGGFMEYNGNDPVQALLPSQLAGYSLTGTGDFPRIAIEDIEDKSKGDIISKGLVILQTGWFVVQCIARGSQSLPITELELVTIAFAGLNFVIYWLWWDKPLNVQRAVRVYKKQSINSPSMEGPIAMKEAGFWLTLWCSLSALVSAIASALRDDGWSWPLPTFADIAGAGGNDAYAVVEDEKRISTFYPPLPPINSKPWRIVLFTTPAVAVVFGAIHCIAWRFAFPSDAERILWRVNSVVITSTPILFAVMAVVESFDLIDPEVDLSLALPGVAGDFLGVLFIGLVILLAVLVYICAFVYPIGRVFLLVLPFLSLRALPAEAYLSVHWTTLIPHI